MFKTVQEAFQYLVQQYRQNTGKFPIGKQIDDLMNQAKQMFSKETLTLTDEVKPTFSVVDEKKLPKAQIEALPLSDKEKAAAAVKKKIDAQNVQAKQSIEGGESSGGQRGAPELVDENFGQTLYIDSSEMMQIMDDAQRKFDAASDAVARGDYDDARAILRFEIEDNYKLPQATRDAAYDARVFIRRGEGINPKEMGYETMEETLEALNEQIAKGIQTTYQDNWPLYTAPDDASNMKSIEYVDFLDEAGEDFGTKNSQIITPSDMDYEYADGGRVGFFAGGVTASDIIKKPTSKISEVNQLANQYIQNTTGQFIDKNKNGIDDRIEGFADGGRVGFNEGGTASAKDFIESTGDSELMDIYIKVLDGTLPEDALTKALEKKGYKTYATGGRVMKLTGGTVNTGQLKGIPNSLLYKPVPLPKAFPPNMTPDEYLQQQRQLMTANAIRPVSVPEPEPTPTPAPLPELSEVDELANQYIKNTTGQFIDKNKNGIDDRLEGFADGGRVGLAGGASLKYMIDFILRNARKVTKKVPSKQFLEKMAEMNPQNIVNAYEDVKKRAGIIDDPDVLMGQAPKTDLEKIKSKVKKDKEGIQQLADDNQIPVRDDTGPKTKTIKKIITAEELKALGKKEGISEQDVEKFLSGELGLLKRGQARGVVQRDKEGNIVIKDKYSKKYDPLRETPVFKDETITIPEPFAGKFKDEFMAHDNLFGKRSGDNKIDAELIAEQVAEMKGLDYDDLPYKEQLDLYDKAYNYLGLLDRTKSAMKEAKGRTLQASGGLAYLMGL